MLTRRDFEARELRELGPCAAKAAQTRGRVHAEPEHEYRTAYQRDRDRVVHSTAFRRLEYKTQVFLTHEGDFFRTRLTHTMEVAQIARTLARALNLNEDLTEAVALAHDLGHTPFGHSGEQALRELMADHGGFEHNRHGVRIIDCLEHPYPQFRGLNLTWEVRECIAKHATQYDHPAVEGFGDAPPPLEGQVVEIADSIAYDSHDLDDALTMGIILAGDLESLAIFQQAAADFEKTLADLSLDQRIRRIAKLLIDLMVSDVIGTTEREIADAGVASVANVRAAGRRLVRLSPDLETKARELEAFLMDRVYRHYRVVRMTTKARRFITRIFEAYRANPDQLRPDYRRRVDAEGLERVIADYIAGMTDRFAQDEYQRLYEPFERV
ncbi:MAG: deoxyguanosinetriphosphate triphosphohydrolase [Planctomycetes bacterium DG_20]|nr:MAG: deoxyguanosinetriphosphate triphosphohydrolase [Planctomycetes bacterium DG_20]